MAAEPNPPMMLVAGATVTVSGIYRVEHARGHRPPSDCVMLAGMMLPHCPECGSGVVFTLVRSAPSAGEDPDFSTD